MSANLNQEAVKAYRSLAAAQVDVEVVETTASTNSDLMARLPTLVSPVLRVARNQTAGRGRAGRVWHSVEADVLTFSVAWYFDATPNKLMGLPLAVGVSIAEVLGELGVQVKLKWPNDILKEQKKLAGILIEIASTDADKTWAVIGIGLNLRVPESVEKNIGHSVADAPWLAQMDRNQLLGHIVNALVHSLQQFQTQGFSAFTQRWNAHHAYANQAVQILDGGHCVQQGIASGVDVNGYLILQTASGPVSIIAGDVSLRSTKETC
jgi:BirA family biotin operon repressor/biotin-[acetyl-CoA-carboxylase] ligase